VPNKLDNDEAQKREGCDPTYKKVRGFQPLQLIWEGKIVDAIFRRGKRHSNYGTDVAKIVRKIVTLIRSRYDASVSIIFRLDAGFFDEKNLLCVTNCISASLPRERQRKASLELCPFLLPV